MDILKQVLFNNLKVYAIEITTITKQKRAVTYDKFVRLYKGLCIEDATDQAYLDFKDEAIQNVEWLEYLPYEYAIKLALGEDCENTVQEYMASIGYLNYIEGMAFRWDEDFNYTTKEAATV